MVGAVYNEAIALAGNTYSGANNRGSWSKTLKWKANEIVEFTTNAEDNSFKVKNVETGDFAQFNFTDANELKDNEY